MIQMILMLSSICHLTHSLVCYERNMLHTIPVASQNLPCSHGKPKRTHRINHMEMVFTKQIPIQAIGREHHGTL